MFKEEKLLYSVSPTIQVIQKVDIHQTEVYDFGIVKNKQTHLKIHDRRM